ncbi:MAG: hypothetical protein OXG88_02025 [Gammaproteobacteria bacterium]|nr:hypothetical protein [Gammaproteobacteria bacterium]
MSKRSLGIQFTILHLSLTAATPLDFLLSQTKITISDIPALLHQYWYLDIFMVMISFAIPVVLSMFTYNLLMRSKDPTE